MLLPLCHRILLAKPHQQPTTRESPEPLQTKSGESTSSPVRANRHRAASPQKATNVTCSEDSSLDTLPGQAALRPMNIFTTATWTPTQKLKFSIKKPNFIASIMDLSLALKADRSHILKSSANTPAQQLALFWTRHRNCRGMAVLLCRGQENVRDAFFFFPSIES